jgi:predicted nucleotidyltransferase
MGNLGELLSGGTVRLLTHFLVRPDQRLHLRALQERTGMGMGALQRELRRFEALGLVRRVEERGRVYFDPVPGHPSWTAFRTLLREHGDPVEVVREVLRDVPGIKAAFVFGSTARGGARTGSDVDVLIVEEGMPAAAIGRAMIEAESLLGRSLDVKRLTPAVLAEKLRRGSAFLRDVASGPKAWLIGSEDVLLAR